MRFVILDIYIHDDDDDDDDDDDYVCVCRICFVPDLFYVFFSLFQSIFCVCVCVIFAAATSSKEKV